MIGSCIIIFAVNFSNKSYSCKSNIIGCTLLIPAAISSLISNDHTPSDYLYLLSAFFFTLTGVFDFQNFLNLKDKNLLESLIVNNSRIGGIFSIITGLTFGYGTILMMNRQGEMSSMYAHACYGSIIVNMYILLINLVVERILSKKGSITLNGFNFFSKDINCNALPLSCIQAELLDEIFWLRLITISFSLLGTEYFIAGTYMYPVMFYLFGGCFFAAASLLNARVESESKTSTDSACQIIEED